jgi:hypothetical protein
MNKRLKIIYKTYTLILIISVFGIYQYAMAGDSLNDKEIQEHISAEINRQAEKRSSDLSIRHMVKRQLESKKHSSHKKLSILSGRYALPKFPYYSLFFRKNHFIQILADYALSDKAYGSSGGTKDLSSNVFGTDTIVIQDILQVSKLAQAGKLKTGAVVNLATGDDFKKNSYLSILANQKLDLHGWEQRFGVGLHYASNYYGGSLSVGLHIPVVGKTHRLRLKNEVDSDLQAKIIDAEKIVADPEFQFSKKYPGGLQDFLDDILNAKGMKISKTDVTRVDLGDVDGYVHVNIKSKYIDRFNFGGRLVLPLSREKDFGELWNHELGNGGFIQVGSFLSMMWEKGIYFKPYIHAQVDYLIGTGVTRRVPQFKKNGTNDTVLTDCNFALGDGLQFTANAQNEPAFLDSIIRGFADDVHKIKIHSGPEAFFRVGNLFSQVILKNGSFDIHYDLKIKGRSYLGSGGSHTLYDGSVLNTATWSVGHILGAQYSYQANDSFRATFGSTYAVAGRNYPQELTFNLDLNFEF